MRPPTASSTTSTTSRPSLALAHRMRGIRRDMQEKISRLRSRSAERISKRLTSGHKTSEVNSSSSSRSSSIVDSQLQQQQPDDRHDSSPPYRMTKSFSGLPSVEVTSSYNGPFIGRARALVDYAPSPYDRDALRFNVSKYFNNIKGHPGIFCQFPTPLAQLDTELSGFAV